MNEIAKAIEAAARAAPEFTGIVPTQFDSNRILLIDGDILAYSSAGTDDTPTGVARRNLLNKIKTLREISLAATVVVHLTSAASHKGYRYLAAVTQPYQGNRKSLTRPKNWAAMREVMETYKGNDFKIKLWHDREADDGIAYHVAKLQDTRKQEDIFICTRDKDLRMITGCTHLNWDDLSTIFVPRNAWYVESPDPEKPFGIKWFWIQMLSGDIVDHIRGIRGVAVKTAMKRLANCHDASAAAKVILTAYEKEYGKDKAKDVMYEHSLLLWLRDTKGAHVYDVPIHCLHHRTVYFNLIKERIDEYNKVNCDIIKGLSTSKTS